jgi:cellulose synthase/poly-beta-1,6-N-acetylglucosamine synthase-like glycosyltransferase
MTAIGGEGEAWLQPGEGAALRGLTGAQWAVLAGLIVALAYGLVRAPGLTLEALHLILVLMFLVSACCKLSLAGFGRPAEAPATWPLAPLPVYTIVVALYREAAVAAQLMRAIEALDYPSDRLQVILVLEEDDAATLSALAWLRLPPYVEVLVKPPGGPRTKPNALNAALPLAHGAFLTIYDAEDIPQPGQLREAAMRFAADRRLGCLQAPLRVGNARSGFLARQFAIEYAGQFEGVLPGIVRAGAPFPLGGTSNHFRTSLLRQLGGWDPYNVTEDADLGLRIGRSGWRMDMIAAPTREDAPTRFAEWLPQRSRWVKGYIQTWGVHMRDPTTMTLKGFLALQLTLGAAIVGAVLHAPLVAMLFFEVGSNLLAGVIPLSTWADVAVLLLGWAMAVMANAIGAARAGLKMTTRDALASLAYWPLQSLAFLSALRQLATDPYRWDKTPHEPVAPRALLDERTPWRVSREA